MDTLTRLERSALNASFNDLAEELLSLRIQAENAMVKSREISSAGSFVNIYVDEKSPVIDNKSQIIISNTYGKSSIIEHSLGINVFIENGTINCLELYSFDEDWLQFDHNSEYKFYKY